MHDQIEDSTSVDTCKRIGKEQSESATINEVILLFFNTRFLYKNVANIVKLSNCANLKEKLFAPPILLNSHRGNSWKGG